MFHRSILESSRSPEQCRESLRAALAGNDRDEPRGLLLGPLFRVTLTERYSFLRRSRLQYTVYGIIREGENGRASIVCRRFLGLTDPLQLVLIYVGVLLVLSLKPDISPAEELPLLAACSLLACLLALGAVTLGLWLFRQADREEMQGSLDDFLREALGAGER